MEIRRTRFVHLPRRLAPAAQAHAQGGNPQNFKALQTEARPSAAPAAAARTNDAPVLWRAVPEWHTLPGDPAAFTTAGNRAYRRAATLGAPVPQGRLTDRRA